MRGPPSPPLEIAGSALRIPGFRRLVRRLFGSTSLGALSVFLLPFLVYFGGGRYMGSGDTAPAEILPVAILEHGRITLEPFVAPDEPLPYWAKRVDRRIVSNYPIVPGLLNVPVFAVARVLGADVFARRFDLSLFTAAALAALSVLFLFGSLRRICRNNVRALLFSLVYAFGTCVWSVAGIGLFQHAPALFFLTLGLLLLLRETPLSTAGAGLALGLGVLSRPPTVLIAVPLALFVLRRRSSVGSFFAAALLPAGLHAWYAAKYWGSPFSTGQDVGGLGGFGGNPATALAGLLLSPSRGLFVFSPVLLFALPGLVAAFRRSAPALDRALASSVVLVLAFFSLWKIWWGGHSFGYRIILEIVPLLVLLTARVWPELRRHVWVRAAFVAALLFSLGVQYLGARLFPTSFNRDIDREPERLWDPLNSELVLDLREFLRRRGLLAAAMADEPGLVSRPRPREPNAVWSNPQTTPGRIVGVLEWPREGRPIRGPLTIAGWAGAVGDSVEVQVLLSSAQRPLPAARFVRSDVCRILPSLKDCPAVGFAVQVPSPPARFEERVAVVEIRDARGRVRRLAPVWFVWRGDPIVPAAQTGAPSSAERSRPVPSRGPTRPRSSVQNGS